MQRITYSVLLKENRYGNPDTFFPTFSLGKMTLKPFLNKTLQKCLSVSSVHVSFTSYKLL